jgi:regulator of cell morphogenesis and NO signaling
MEIRADVTVADVASAFPATIRVFQEHAIDFCCGGQRPLGQACAERGLAFDVLRAALERAQVGTPQDQPSWNDVSLAALMEHIVARYHVTLRSELPRLAGMLRKVADVHGARHPEVLRLNDIYTALDNDLGPHLMKEEQVLFPFVQRLEQALLTGNDPGPGPCGSVRHPIRAMEAEHELVAEMLGELRTHSGGFIPPDDACNTYRGLYHGLSDLERELHEHIHLENNVLHRRALAIEARVDVAV